MIPATALNGRHSASDFLFTEIHFLKGRDQGWHVPIFSGRHGAPSAGMVRVSYLSPLLMTQKMLLGRTVWRLVAKQGCKGVAEGTPGTGEPLRGSACI